MEKLNERNKATIEQRLKDLFDCDLGDVDFSDDGVHVEVYGKAYGNGEDGWRTWSRNKRGEFEFEEGEGRVRQSTEDTFLEIFKDMPNVAWADLMVQYD